MKVRIIVELSSKNEQSIKSIKDVVQYIRSGKFQRDMESDGTTKCAKCKATVEVLEEEQTRLPVPPDKWETPLG